MAKLLAIVGSTACGKSDFAMRLARETGAHILSCDSLLVYRELTIGTAKPTEAEMAEVQHYGVNIVGLDEPFTAGDYARYARPIVDKAVDNNQPLLIVGGTGFYLKALLCGVWDAPPTQPELRARLDAEVAHLDEEAKALALFAKLEKLDLEYSKKVKANDVYRVIRALEIIEVTGQPMHKMLEQQKLQNPLPYSCPIVGIKRDKAELDRRITQRTNNMFAQGLVQETKDLLQKYATPPRPFYCVGYNEILDFLNGGMNMPQTRERIVISTRQLAKKQMTFFKTFPQPIDWRNFPAEEEDLYAKCKNMLMEKN